MGYFNGRQLDGDQPFGRESGRRRRGLPLPVPRAAVRCRPGAADAGLQHLRLWLPRAGDAKREPRGVHRLPPGADKRDVRHAGSRDRVRRPRL